MAEIDRIAALIRGQLPNVKSGSLRFWGQWFGRPYDNLHSILDATAQAESLFVRDRSGSGDTVMALNLAEVQRRTRELATIIDAPESCLPTMGHTEDFARPHVEVVGPLLHYVVVERGQELLRESFLELEELLFRVFKDVTFQMAAMFELRNRRPSEDSRRLLFARQLELLSLLSPRWADRERAGLCEVLKQHPFGDEVQPRDSLP